MVEAASSGSPVATVQPATPTTAKRMRRSPKLPTALQYREAVDKGEQLISVLRRVVDNALDSTKSTEEKKNAAAAGLRTVIQPLEALEKDLEIIRRQEEEEDKKKQSKARRSPKSSPAASPEKAQKPPVVAKAQNEKDNEMARKQKATMSDELATESDEADARESGKASGRDRNNADDGISSESGNNSDQVSPEKDNETTGHAGCGDNSEFQQRAKRLTELCPELSFFENYVHKDDIKKGKNSNDDHSSAASDDGDNEATAENTGETISHTQSDDDDESSDEHDTRTRYELLYIAIR